MSINTLSKLVIIKTFEKLIPELPSQFEVNCTKLSEIADDLLVAYQLKKDVSLYSKHGIQIMTDDDFQKLIDGDLVYCIPTNLEFPFGKYLQDFETISTLGKGAFGIVNLVQHNVTKEKFALKVTNMSNSYVSANKLNELYTEAKNIKQLSHDNIIKLYNAFVLHKNLFMMTEYIEGGDLTKYLKEKPSLNEEEIKEIIKQIAVATFHSHNNKIIHRDLKLENILIVSKNPMLIKIIDFGLACNQGEAHSSGTLRYLPPECLLSNFESKPSLDVWSIGVILFYLCFRTFPFIGPNAETIKDAIINSTLEVPPNKYSKHLNYILNRLLEKEEKTRMTMLHLVNHDWLKKSNESGIDFSNLESNENLPNYLSPVGSPLYKKEDEKTILSRLELLLESREDIKEDENVKPITTSQEQIEDKKILKTKTGPKQIEKNQSSDLNQIKQRKSTFTLPNSQDYSPTLNLLGSTQKKSFQSNQSKVSQFAPQKLKEVSKKAKTIYFTPGKPELKATGKFK